MWITCSNEGCDYGFVVIKVTSLCWLLPPVSSKAVELSGSSRIQAAVTAASFLTTSFPTAPPHGSLRTRWHFLSHLLRVSYSLADWFCVLLSVFLPAGNSLELLFCSHHSHSAVISPISTDDNGSVATPACTYAPFPTSLCLTFTCWPQWQCVGVWFGCL